MGQMDDAVDAREWSNTRAGADRMFVRFHYVTKQDFKASKPGAPVFKKVEYVHIRLPGDKFNEVDRPATDKDREKYQVRYRAFLKNESQEEADGLMLKAWVLMDPGSRLGPETIEQLAYYNVRTVQHLAAISDGNLPPVPRIIELRKRAQAYLESAKDDRNLKEELSKRDDLIRQLNNRLDEIEKKNVTVGEPAMVPVPIKRRPGRKPKTELPPV